MIGIALMIGLRREVGTDWFAYVAMYKQAYNADLSQLLSFGDPGYQFLNWIVQRLGAGFWLVNLICGSIFAWGLYKLAESQPNPWTAMIIAVPYLVIVVAMGYARQGVAIGILMAGIAKLCRGGSIPSFLYYVAIATLFHRTAVIALPLGMFGLSNKRALHFIVALGGGLVIFDYLLSNHVDAFIGAYVRTEWDSQGAGVRIAMNLVPAITYMLSKNLLGFNTIEKAVWRNFSFAAFLSLAMLYIVPSSTAIDRVSLYIIPIQLAVLPRISVIIKSQIVSNAILVLYSFAVLYVWFNYGVNSQDWVPYQYYLPGIELFGNSGASIE